MSAELPTPSRSGYARVNGVEVYHAVYGTGKPLVLLHGGFGSMEMFGPVLAALAESRQVIGIDLQAHGRTLPFDRPMSPEALAGDVAGVIRLLGHEKADVMGCSLGGCVALRTALDHPAAVDRLVLVSAPYAFTGWHDSTQKGLKTIGAHLAEAMKGTPMYQHYAQIAPDPGNWPKLLAQVGSMSGKEYDWGAEIPGLKSPTLLVVGDYDSVRLGHVVAFFALLGGGKEDGGWDRSTMAPSRLAVLPGSTHYTIFKDPRLVEAVVPFLDGR